MILNFFVATFTNHVMQETKPRKLNLLEFDTTKKKGDACHHRNTHMGFYVLLQLPEGTKKNGWFKKLLPRSQNFSIRRCNPCKAMYDQKGVEPDESQGKLLPEDTIRKCQILTIPWCPRLQFYCFFSHDCQWCNSCFNFFYSWIINAKQTVLLRFDLSHSKTVVYMRPSTPESRDEDLYMNDICMKWCHETICRETLTGWKDLYVKTKSNYEARHFM